jgi:hypothetical protein
MPIKTAVERHFYPFCASVSMTNSPLVEWRLIFPVKIIFSSGEYWGKYTVCTDA